MGRYGLPSIEQPAEEGVAPGTVAAVPTPTESARAVALWTSSVMSLAACMMAISAGDFTWRQASVIVAALVKPKLFPARRSPSSSATSACRSGTPPADGASGALLSHPRGGTSCAAASSAWRWAS